MAGYSSAPRGGASRLRDALVWLALIAALGGPLVFAAAGLGTRAGLWGWQFGLGVLARDVARYVLYAGLGLSVLALIAAFVAPPRGRGAVIALVALIVAGGTAWQASSIQAAAQDVPPLHDVTTDPEDPPAFAEGIAERRGPEAAAIDIDAPMPAFIPAYAGRTVREVSAEAYDDLATVQTDLPAGRAFEAALAAARDMGWEIALTDAETGRIEAVATTFWFGFKDDIVIRVQETGEGAEIDVRSVSRVGLSDLGANAARIRAYLEDLEGELT